MSLIQADPADFDTSGLEAPVAGYGSRVAKRLFDVAVAATALTLLAPVMVVAAVAVKTTSRGPLIFRQDRYGRDRGVFGCLKFRTMTVCESADQFVQATKNDARVTRVGRVLRKTSIDELPQLFNVLAGSMSIVGPRPHPIKLDDTFAQQIVGYDRRFLVKPGITGLAQIRGHRGPTETVAAMAERVHSDVEYVRDRSLRADIAITAKTLPAILFGADAF